jgi:hypothetical protein
VSFYIHALDPHMFLLYHYEGCNTSGTVFYWCYINNLHTTPCRWLTTTSPTLSGPGLALKPMALEAMYACNNIDGQGYLNRTYAHLSSHTLTASATACKSSSPALAGYEDAQLGYSSRCRRRESPPWGNPACARNLPSPPQAAAPPTLQPPLQQSGRNGRYVPLQ